MLEASQGINLNVFAYYKNKDKHIHILHSLWNSDGRSVNPLSHWTELKSECSKYCHLNQSYGYMCTENKIPEKPFDFCFSFLQVALSLEDHSSEVQVVKHLLHILFPDPLPNPFSPPYSVCSLPESTEQMDDSSLGSPQATGHVGGREGAAAMQRGPGFSPALFSMEMALSHQSLVPVLLTHVLPRGQRERRHRRDKGQEGRGSSRNRRGRGNCSSVCAEVFISTFTTLGGVQGWPLMFLQRKESFS